MRPLFIVLAAGAFALALPSAGAISAPAQAPQSPGSRLSASPFLAPPPTDDAVMLKGLAAFRRGDHVAARDYFRTLASRGDPAAETLLGTMTANGQGGPRDDAVAAAWFLRAARRGYAPAQMALANSFARGRGVPKDLIRAKTLAQAAAIQGQPGAAQLAARVTPESYALLMIRP